MKFYIKGMDYYHKENMVKDIVEALGLYCCSAKKGELVIKEDLVDEQRNQLESALSNKGFKLLNEKETVIIERIIFLVIQNVHHSGSVPIDIDLQVLILKDLGYGLKSSYPFNLFFNVTGETIQKFILKNKMELVKKLLDYDKFTLPQICKKLNCNKPSNLSAQFKKFYGKTITEYIKGTPLKNKWD